MTSCINPHILREIAEKKKAIALNDFSKLVGAQVIHGLCREALFHSGFLEGETANRAKHIKHKTEYHEAKNGLLDAWDYGQKHYRGSINPNFIFEVVKRIEPDRDILGYRSDDVRITGNDPVFPVSHRKVGEQMDKLLDIVNNSTESVIDSAGKLHFNFVRIHPLADGNGRTARLLQNIILNYNGYGPCHIEGGERDIYQSLLRAGLRDFRERSSTGEYPEIELMNYPLVERSNEKMFLDFLASKVNVSMGRAVEAIDKSPFYEVRFKRKNNFGEVITIKHALKSYVKKRGIIAEIHANKPLGILEIRGNVPVEPMVETIRKRYNGDFSLYLNHERVKNL